MTRVVHRDEQDAAASRIGTYVQRWQRWRPAGLDGVVAEIAY
ncbi:MAG: hypothetical protein P0121_04530 [Nitrospira sp.]|nr:hypothetical protein [Nitrospira sp.]